MAYGFGTDARNRGGLGSAPRSRSYTPYYPPASWRPPGLTPLTPSNSPWLATRVARATSALPPIPFSSTDTAGGAAPPGYGDLLSQLLAGLAGPPSGIPPEEGLAQAQRALIQYGGVPQGLSGLKNLAGAFDKGTSALAKENTTSGVSILARINQAHADQNRYIKNRLAAHGLLDSGETGFQVGREQTNFARASADSASKLLDYLSGINSGVTAYLQWQAMMAALANIGQGGGGGTGVSSTGSISEAPHTIVRTPSGYWQSGRGYVQSPYQQSSRGHGTNFIAL